MSELNREKATKEGFVWIPTGHMFGKPDGIVGYWHGEVKDGKPQVEFTTGTVSVNPNAIYVATEKEIAEDAI